MSRPTPDMRAVVRALDALTTQVRRIADYRQTDFALTPDAADDAPTTADDACRTVEIDGETVHVRGSGDFTDQDAQYLGEIVRAAKRKFEAEQAPAADEDAQRTTRRDSAHNLLARLDRGGLLTPADCTLLRQHFDTEARQHDTARSVARSNLRHVQTLIPELEQAQTHVQHLEKDYAEMAGWFNEATNRAEQTEQRLGRIRDMADAWERRLPATIRTATAAEAVRLAAVGDDRPVMFGVVPAQPDVELEQAQAAIKRVRHIATLIDTGAPWTANQHETARRILAALDGTDQPTTEE